MLLIIYAGWKQKVLKEIFSLTTFFSLAVSSGRPEAKCVTENVISEKKR